MTSSYDFILVIEADYGSALNNVDQVGFLKFDPDFCPKNFVRSDFEFLSVGNSQEPMGDNFWYEASISEPGNFFNQALQFRTNVSEV